MIPKLCFTAQKRAAISPDPSKRGAVVPNGRTTDWKAVIMARAVGEPGFERDHRENAQGLGWMAQDFTATLKGMHESCDFVFKPGRVIARYLGQAVGEMDYSLRFSPYLGRYIYCNAPHWYGSEIRMGVTKYPDQKVRYYYLSDAHESGGTWAPVGIRVEEEFQRKGIGSLLVAAAMMREYHNSKAKFIVIGDPGKETVKIGQKLGMMFFAHANVMSGHIDPVAIGNRMSALTDLVI